MSIRNSAFQPPENAIVFSTPSDDAFWERRRQTAAGKISTNTINTLKSMPNLQTTIDFIHLLSKNEYKKEQELMNKLPDFKFDNTQDFITNFNYLLQGKKRFEDTLKRMKKAVEWGKTKQTKKGETYKGLAPNMSSYFATYLSAALRKNINNFIQNLNLNDTTQDWENNYYKIIDQSVLETIQNMKKIPYSDEELSGGAQDWAEIAEGLLNMPGMFDNFREALYTHLGISNIQNIYKQIIEDNKNKINSNFSYLINENLKLDSRTASIGGNVIEHAIGAVVNNLYNLQGGNQSVQYKVYGDAISGQQVKTDSAIIFQTNTEVKLDAQGLFNSLNNLLSNNTKSLDAAQDKIQEFYDRNFSSLKDNFIVYVNSKNYSLGSNSRTITDTKKGLLNTLPDFLNRAEFVIGDPLEFLKTAYNTAQGAVSETMRGKVQEGVEQAIKAAAAKLMFDDYQTIGDELNSSPVNAIHAYFLSGMYVPASVVFETLALAMEKATTHIDASVSAFVQLPESINTREYAQFKENLKGLPDQQAKQAIIDEWQNQWHKAEQESQWSATFKVNIISIVNSLVRQYG